MSIFPRRLGLLSLIALAMLAAWFIVTGTAAEYWSSDRPQAALAIDPGNADALLQLASKELKETEPDLDAVERLASRALVSKPLSWEAMVVLGIVAEKRQDKEHFEQLMRLASERSFRNSYPQTWVINRLLSEGNIDRALYHMDGLFRARPAARDAFLVTLMGIALKQDSVDLVGQFLATNPTWRRWFIASFAQSVEDPLLLRPLIDAITQAGSALSDYELQFLLQRFVATQHYTEARELWRNTRPQDHRDDAFIYNGGFSFPPDGTAFDWSIRSAPGSSVRVETVPTQPGNKALLIEFNAKRIVFNQITQTLTLAPGSYSFSVRSKVEALRNDRGLWWRLICHGKKPINLGSTDLIRGTSPWMTSGFEFVVPEDCPAQIIRLELPARGVLEEKIEGRVWYDDVSIRRNPSSAANLGAK